MTGKEKIRAEIKRLFGEWKWYNSIEGKYRCKAYRELLRYINSLPEETVSEDLKEEIDNYISEHFFGSETLGFFSSRSKEEPNYIDIDETAKYFANWQKEKDIKASKEVYADLLSAKGYDIGSINSEVNRLERIIKEEEK